MQRWIRALLPVVVALLGVGGVLGNDGMRPTMAAGSVRYVAPGGNCGGAAPCYATPQAAADAAQAGDEIRVAGGSYLGTSSRAGHTQALYVDKELTVRGGYALPFATAPDPAANPTILDAGEQGRVVYLSPQISATLEGLRLVNGSRLGGTEPDRSDAGGGLYGLSVTLTLRDMELLANDSHLGGGLYLEGASAHIERSRFVANRALPLGNERISLGGGLFLARTQLTLVDSEVQRNLAQGLDYAQGGGLYAQNSQLSLVGSTFSTNTLTATLLVSGGGLFVAGGETTIFRSTFVGNQAKVPSAGQGIQGAFGAGLYAASVPQITVRESAFRGNSTNGNRAFGPAFGIDGTDIHLADNTIEQNRAAGSNAGLTAFIQGDRATVANNRVSDNQVLGGSGAQDTGFCGGFSVTEMTVSLLANQIEDNIVEGRAASAGGLCLDRSEALLVGNTVGGNRVTATLTADGGGIWASESRLKLVANRFTDNFTTATIDSGRRGGAFYMSNSRATLTSDTFLHNQALVGGAIALVTGSQLTMSNSLVAQNIATSYASGIYVEGSTARLLHTTIASNSGGNGTGVHATSSNVALTNTILVSQTVGVYVAPSGVVRLNGTLWGAGAWANGSDWISEGSIMTGTVNLWAEPGFVAPATDDYHLAPDSAAIDAGLPTEVRTDYDGEPRPNQLPDLGADEYWPSGTLQELFLPLVLR